MNNIKTNKDSLVECILQCKPGHPKVSKTHNVDVEGRPFILPSIGGIVTNISVGDSVFGWAGDHIEPGVSCTSDTKKPFEHPNTSLQLLACAGNTAAIISGDAEGSEGYVVGKHGGSEHLIIEFDEEVKRILTYDDTIIINAVGQGLEMIDHPNIMLFNIDPRLFEKIEVEVSKTFDKIYFPVTTMIPAFCMGSGIGASNVATGDYDIMTSDSDTFERYQFSKMRFGDLVALIDQDNRYGRSFKKGAVSIGIIVHSDCRKAGHGPGVMTIATCGNGEIQPVENVNANIGLQI